ncbi:MAG: M23 family metallopeptidase [Mycobacterium sp.]
MWEASRGPRDRWSPPHPNEVTDIIPFNEFGNLDDLGFSDNIAFDSEAQVLAAPELDDLHDTDNLTALRLALPRSRPDPYRYRRRPAEPSGMPARRGKHRSQPNSAVKSRVLIASMAAGAAAAAAHAATHPSGTASARTVLAASDSPLGDGTDNTASRGMQMVTVKPAANIVVHNEELARGVAFAQERAEREARLQRPLFVMPTRGMFTSNFGYRWGVLHGGIDIANSIGTPIFAASDGVVIEAGPSAGYGMLVKLRHSDGTVTLYGHVNSTTVSVGGLVMAGDQIATMGNRGNSTGPHLHFEVLLGGTNRVDPTPWLTTRGIDFGA